MNATDERWLDLAGAIVRQAADDYRRAKRVVAYLDRKPVLTRKDTDSMRSAKRAIAEVKQFFKSDWCSTLCGGIDPQYIFKKIEDELT